MIPMAATLLQSDFEIVEGPSHTYRLDSGLLSLSGHVDELAAVAQAVYLILNIERYVYVIYDWNYGVELQDLIGQPMSFAIPEIKRRVTEALLQDTRVTGVTDFVFTRGQRTVSVKFVANTIYGDVAAERQVEI